MSDPTTDLMFARMDAQRAEFKATERLAQQWRCMSLMSPVDDDYPEIQRNYEIAVAEFIASMKANGRFEAGNRYGLRPVRGTRDD